MRTGKMTAQAKESDHLDFEKAIRGDERAFAALYHRHVAYVAGIMYRVLGGEVDLDDILQESFFIAARKLDTLRDPKSLRPWLVRIALSRARRRLDQHRRRRAAHSQLAQVAPRCSEPRNGEMVRVLYQSLDQLPSKLRIPWVMCRVSGEPLAAVAEACEISLATTKRRIAKAESFLEGRLSNG